MNAWLIASLALLPPLAVAVGAACRGTTAGRLVAVQLTGSLATLVLVMLTFAFDQSSFIDLGLALAVLSITGGMLFAFFVERWL